MPSGPSVGAFSTGKYDIEITVSATGTEQDARLRIDPGLIVKAAGSRIETTIGAQLIVEGERERSITFTSLRDDRYGGGGTFDTNADQATTFTSPGDWGGFFVGPLSQGSFDNVLVTFAGGRTRIEGNFDQFNALEIHQADVRVTNSIFEDNAAGLATTNRSGRGSNSAATIFVRGAQPILVDNIIRDGLGTAISINANAMQAQPNSDFGRTTGWAQTFDEHDGGRDRWSSAIGWRAMSPTAWKSARRRSPRRPSGTTSISFTSYAARSWFRTITSTADCVCRAARPRAWW